MLCNALLLQGHCSRPQPEESGMDLWQSLAQAGSGYSEVSEDKEAEHAAARRQEIVSTKLRQLPLSLHVTCSATFPNQAPTTQACEHHQLLLLTEPSFFEPVWAHKNKCFSFLSLNPDFQGNRMVFTALYLISDQNSTAAHDRSHSHFTPLPSALKFPVSRVHTFVLIILQSYFTTEV